MFKLMIAHFYYEQYSCQQDEIIDPGRMECVKKGESVNKGERFYSAEKLIQKTSGLSFKYF